MDRVIADVIRCACCGRERRPRWVLRPDLVVCDECVVRVLRAPLN